MNIHKILKPSSRNLWFARIGVGLFAFQPPAYGLNPQPLPPPRNSAIAFYTTDPFATRALNPQPLPPKVLSTELSNLTQTRMLNPQPLPPKIDYGLTVITETRSFRR